MRKSIALILAKSQSKRLPNKNILPINGEPMFLVNVKKCQKVFDRVYVSSDSLDILEQATNIGAIPIRRPLSLCGDVPNIPVYKHALKEISEDIIVAVQANSPTLDINLIRLAKKIMEEGKSELMTCYPDYSIYGSIWAITKDKIIDYKDFYNPKPDVLLVDESVDIHTQQDYERALIDIINI